jgi:predicted NBD/HSP70 family sugar kinase
MRKINTRDFHLATRTTVRDVNRQIVLNLVREHGPISRADLARKMEVARSAVTEIVRELIAADSIYESGVPEVDGPGRRPTMLRLRTRGHVAVAVDIRANTTVIALVDFAGNAVAREAFRTPESPDAVIEALVPRIRRLLDAYTPPDGNVECHGIGVVVPGMVDRRTGSVLYAPRLGWRNVELRDRLSARLDCSVQIESAPIACALARLWLSPDGSQTAQSFAYVSISDGVGVGLVVDGDVVRGQAHTAGEFGHISLDPAGPECACGRRGCWEAFVCNGATVERYAERIVSQRIGGPVSHVRWNREPAPAVEEVIRRAQQGQPAAVETLRETGHHIGRGLAAVVSAFNPGRIYVGGEITAAWPLLREPLFTALAEGTLTDAAQRTPVVPDGTPAEYRLLGAVALVAAPTYAALSVG